MTDRFQLKCIPTRAIVKSAILADCIVIIDTVELLLRSQPDERPTPLERPLDTVNLNINVLIYTPDEMPPLLKGHFSGAKGVALQEGFHCIDFEIYFITLYHDTLLQYIVFMFITRNKNSERLFF